LENIGKIPLGQQVQTACKWEADKLLSRGSLKGNTIGDLHTYLSENTLRKFQKVHENTHLAFYMAGVLMGQLILSQKQLIFVL
jgi:hypothetical protein